MNAFTHTTAIIAIVNDDPRETVAGRYAYGMGLPLSPFWSARKRAGWYLAKDEHDEIADEEAAA